jgi:hypothetical protein
LSPVQIRPGALSFYLFGIIRETRIQSVFTIAKGS